MAYPCSAPPGGYGIPSAQQFLIDELHRGAGDSKLLGEFTGREQQLTRGPDTLCNIINGLIQQLLPDRACILTVDEHHKESLPVVVSLQRLNYGLVETVLFGYFSTIQ